MVCLYLNQCHHRDARNRADRQELVKLTAEEQLLTDSEPLIVPLQSVLLVLTSCFCVFYLLTKLYPGLGLELTLNLTITPTVFSNLTLNTYLK